MLNTTGTIVCFRVGFRDASFLSRELFPPRYLEATHWELKSVRFGRYPVPFPVQYRDPLGHEDLATILTQLQPRQFVARHRGPYPPIKQHTFNMPAPRISEGLYRLREELARVSGERYGRLKWRVREELKHEQPIVNGQYTTYYEEIPTAALPAGE